MVVPAPLSEWLSCAPPAIQCSCFKQSRSWMREGSKTYLRIDNLSLTSLQRLVKTGGGLIKPSRYYWRLLTESHLPRRLFGAMVGRIAA
jgi:hypothetical protein